MSNKKNSWNDTFSLMFQKEVLTMVFLGFSAGIPILLIFSSLSLWLKDAEVSRSTITFFSWAALSYSFKFIWAPLIDNLTLGKLTVLLGRRRSWILLSQFFIVISILLMAFSEPQQSLILTAAAAVMLGLSSATQDTVIDAYRIETATGDMRSMLSGAYITGYRIGMITSGAGALFIAGWLGTDVGYTPHAWTIAYACMAFAMLLGIGTTLIIKEPKTYQDVNPVFKDSTNVIRFLLCFILCVTIFAIVFSQIGTVLQEIKNWLLNHVSSNKRTAAFIANVIQLWAGILCGGLTSYFLIKLNFIPKAMVVEGYINPIKNFFDKYAKTALLILLLISLYRLSDIVMGVIANVFYSDLGFSKIDIATYSKSYGLFATIAGGILGGLIAVRYGVYKALLCGAVLSALTNILFAVMVGLDKSESILFMTITADNISGGIANTAFVIYLSSLTSVSFTAMQYAIFSSLMTLFPKLLAGYSGAISTEVGYENFFYITAIMGIPAMILVIILNKVVPVEKLN